MKYILCTILSLGLLNSLYGIHGSDISKREFNWSIVGRWQKDTPQMSSAWMENYQFYANGKFVYNFSQYDVMKRILSISGTYRIENQLIYFKVTSRIEWVGGYVSRGASGSELHGWVLSGKGKTIEINQADSSTEENAILKQIAKDSSQCIQIDNEKFYKISDNPDAE